MILLKELIVELEFNDKNSYSDYISKHKVRDSTKVKIGDKITTVGKEKESGSINDSSILSQFEEHFYDRYKQWDANRINKQLQKIPEYSKKHGVNLSDALKNPSTILNLMDKPISSSEDNTKTVIDMIDKAFFWSGTSRILNALKKAYPLNTKDEKNNKTDKEKKSKDEKPTNYKDAKYKLMKSGPSSATVHKIDLQNSKTLYEDWISKFEGDKEKFDNYYKDIVRWQVDGNKDSINKLDNFIKRNPIPPIKTNKPVFRGMAMNDSELKDFLSQFSEGNTVELPISSFSFDSKISADFSDYKKTSNFSILKNSDKKNSVFLTLEGTNSQLNGLPVNSTMFIPEEKRPRFDNVRDSVNFTRNKPEAYFHQKEILIPSGNVLINKIETQEYDGRVVTIIHLTQPNNKNESKLKKSKGIDILKTFLQYPMRVKKETKGTKIKNEHL